MQIVKSKLPENSLIAKSFSEVDYSDFYTSRFHSDHKISLNDCISSFLFRWPRWVYFLMDLRNILVVPFGLKTDKEYKHSSKTSSEITISKGAYIGFFEVWDCNNQEVMLGINDKHLNARSSIILKNQDDEYEIGLATVVRYNNVLGEIYFLIIRLFHVMIIKTLLHRMIKENKQ